MAYAHDGYLELTDDRERAAELRRHITEVSSGILANVNKGASARQSDPLVAYRAELRKELKDLEDRIAQSGGGFHYARISRG